MKLLLVDDEPLALQRLQRLLKGHAAVTQLLTASSAKEALAVYTAKRADAVLLDIEMPGMNGLQLAEVLRNESSPPAIVFLTAHPEHALQAYDYAALDYLLKPVSAERLDQALQRMLQYIQSRQASNLVQPSASGRHLCVHLGNRLLRVPLDEVVCCVAEDKYVRLFHSQGEALLNQSLTQLETEFPDVLLRIHRNALVNRACIQALEALQGSHYVQLLGYAGKLEVSRRRVGALKQYLL